MTNKIIILIYIVAYFYFVHLNISNADYNTKNILRTSYSTILSKYDDHITLKQNSKKFKKNAHTCEQDLTQLFFIKINFYKKNLQKYLTLNQMKKNLNLYTYQIYLSQSEIDKIYFLFVHSTIKKDSTHLKHNITIKKQIYTQTNNHRLKNIT